MNPADGMDSECLSYQGIVVASRLRRRVASGSEPRTGFTAFRRADVLDVDPSDARIEWGERFHFKRLVSEADMRLIAEQMASTTT